MATSELHPDFASLTEDGVSRRNLLKGGAAGGLGLVLTGSLELLFSGSAGAAAPGGGGYGPPYTPHS